MEFAVGILAVVDFSSKVISRCQAYITGVQDCPSDVRGILVETGALRSVLENVKFLYDNSPSPELKQLLHGLNGTTGPVPQCLECLKKVEDLLPAIQTFDRSKPKRPATLSTRERLAWPLKETKARKLLDEMARLRTSISLTLATDISHKITSLDSKIETLRDHLHDNLREKMLKWIVSTNPSEFHNSQLSLRDDTTGKWLHKVPEYIQWKAGSNPLFWSYGIPGAGKTILFSRIVQDIKSHCSSQPQETFVCIFYYCYFGRGQDESTHWVRWILSQLARRAKFIPSNIIQLYESEHAPPLQEMMDAIAQLSALFDRVYLLIDGVDESLQRSNLLKVIDKFLSNQFTNLSLLAISRDESDIRAALSGVATELSLSNPYVDEDIALYIRGELTRNRRLRIHPADARREIEVALTAGAQGMFRWAACQVEILSKLHSYSEIRDALRSLPKGLDATYERVLANIPTEYQNRARLALLYLSGPESDELSDPDVLAEAIIVDIDTMSFNSADRLLRPTEFLSELCTCLVTVSRHDSNKTPPVKIRLAHYTVKEFLYSPRILQSDAKFYYSSRDEAIFTARMASIAYLLTISCDGVPSAHEYLLATTERQKEYDVYIQHCFPLLEFAIYRIHGAARLNLEDSRSREKLDEASVDLFMSSRRRWLEWRAVLEIGNFWCPLWEPVPGMEIETALSMALFHELSTVVSMILRKHPQVASSGAVFVLDPIYAGYSAALVSHVFKDTVEDVQDYIPSGTSCLEVALFFSRTSCLEPLLAELPNPGQHISPSGLSLLSTAVKAGQLDDIDPNRLAAIEVLLDAGVEVNLQSVSETPLQSAAKVVDLAVIRHLLAAGALVNEVGDDIAIIRKIELSHRGDTETGKQAVSIRGSGKNYKTPLLILLDDFDSEHAWWSDASEAIQILKDHGGLPLHLFPKKGLPGFKPQDWEALKTAGWHGTRYSEDFLAGQDIPE